MAGTEFNVKLTTDTKALREIRKEMDKFAKETKKNFDKQIKLEGRYNKRRKRELDMQKRIAVGNAKDQLKHAKDLQKVKSGQRKEEWAHNRKVWREQKRERTETTRWRQKEQKSIARGSVGSQIRGGVRRAGSMVAGAAGGLTGMFVGATMSAFGKHMQVAQASRQTMGMSGRGRFNTNVLPGTQYGFNRGEGYGHAAAMGRATGVMGPREMQQTMTATGLQAGEAGQMFSGLTQAGLSFKGGEKGGSSAGKRALEQMFAKSFHSGLSKARFPEFAKGVFSIAKQVGGKISGDVNVGQIGSVLAALQNTGKSGLTGERGAAVASTMNQAFQQQGGAGGEWGKGLFLRAAGFGGQKNNEDYFGARMKMTKGISGKGNVEALLNQVLSESGGSAKEAALQLEASTGMGLDQAYAMIQEHKAGNLNIAEAEKKLKPEETFEERSLSAMEDMGGYLKSQASHFDRMATVGAAQAENIQKLQDAMILAFEVLTEAVKAMWPYLKIMAKHIAEMASVVIQWLGTTEGITPDQAAVSNAQAAALEEQAEKTQDEDAKNRLLAEAKELREKAYTANAEARYNGPVGKIKKGAVSGLNTIARVREIGSGGFGGLSGLGGGFGGGSGIADMVDEAFEMEAKKERRKAIEGLAENPLSQMKEVLSKHPDLFKQEDFFSTGRGGEAFAADISTEKGRKDLAERAKARKDSAQGILPGGTLTGDPVFEKMLEALQDISGNTPDQKTIPAPAGTASGGAVGGTAGSI